jgi:hypothetical protein
MPSILGSFLLTVSTERQHCVGSGGEATVAQLPIVNDNAKMMPRTFCASYSSAAIATPAESRHHCVEKRRNQGHREHGL